MMKLRVSVTRVKDKTVVYFWRNGKCWPCRAPTSSSLLRLSVVVQRGVFKNGLVVPYVGTHYTSWSFYTREQESEKYDKEAQDKDQES